MSKSFLVVGAGLAGSSIALRLLWAKNDVKVVDCGTNSSTAIAAGMVNPMVFRRMNKSWRLDEFMQYAEPFYKKLEELYKEKLFSPITIRRLFSSQQEKNFWLERQEDANYSSYLNRISPEDEGFDSAKNDFGSGTVNEGFWINAKVFYKSSLDYFRSLNCLLEEHFDYAEFNPEKASYQGITYDGVIFCVGFKQFEIPFFNNLPVQTTKGQVLTVHSQALPENESLNRKCFVLPIGNQNFKVGATYEWNQTDLNLTPEAKAHLLGNLAVLTDSKVEVVEQQAGIRPTTIDRRPIMGRHAVFSKLYVFNGLGTKGYMMAPLLSQEMTDFILEGKALNAEVRLERFS